jgi:hypothetical protein
MSALSRRIAMADYDNWRPWLLGGWMASGEPMSWTYYRRRTLAESERPRRVA